MLENQVSALHTLKEMTELIERARHLLTLGVQGDFAAFDKSAMKILGAFQMLISSEREGFSFHTLESISDSLKRIIVYAKVRSAKTLDKIEFELLPLMKECYKGFYFFNCIYPEKPLMKKYYQQEMAELGANTYIDEAVRRGHYKYDLSIAVLAFNNLEYTKACVESIIRYVPKELSYELILINHGSTDGTKAYFECLGPTKQLDILINGAGVGAYTRICEGKYFLQVSNDVMVTENAITNMICCMDSDEKIAWVVPTTPNVSNYQSIPSDYKTIDEMNEFARKNNRSNPYRWEQRVRLCDPISLRRSSTSFSSFGVLWATYFYTDMEGGFSDDKEALLYRRNGYKIMLAKDSFCHHFGSVTLKDEIAKQDSFYERGRKSFFDAFGIDPWGTGVCWSKELMSILPCREKGHVHILGINCGLGSNPLKIKETIKENVQNLNVILYNVTDDHRYHEDLRGVSDVVECLQPLGDTDDIFKGVIFNYIVYESGLERQPDPLIVLKKLENRLTEGGYLIFQMPDVSVRGQICKTYPTFATAGVWAVITKKMV